MHAVRGLCCEHGAVLQDLRGLSDGWDSLQIDQSVDLQFPRTPLFRQLIPMKKTTSSKTAVEKDTSLSLDTSALDAAKRSLDQGVITPSYGPWRDDIVR